MFGALASGCHYAAYLLLVARGGLDPVPATLLGTALGTVLSYALNLRYTFGGSTSLGRVARFWTVTALGAALNAALVALGIALGLPVAPVGLVAIGLAAAFNFVAHRAWTFRAPPP